MMPFARKPKPGRSHPFVVALENGLAERGFQFGYIDETDRRLIQYFGSIEEYGRSFIEILYQPDKHNSWFRFDIGIQTPYLADIYNGLCLWECLEGSRPISKPVKVVHQYLQVLCSTADPPVKRLKWGTEKDLLDESVNQALKDIDDYAIPFLSNFQSWESILDYLINRPNVPSNARLSALDESLVIALLKKYVGEPEEALFWLNSWRSETTAVLERNFQTEQLAEKTECLSLEYQKIKHYIEENTLEEISPQCLKSRYQLIANNKIPYEISHLLHAQKHYPT